MTNIPKIPQLEEFLETLSLAKPANVTNYKSVLAVKSEIASGRDEYSNSISPTPTPEYTIWYKPVEKFALEALVGIIRSKLDRYNHPTDQNIILGIICLYLLFVDIQDEDRASFLYHILDTLVRTNAYLFFVLPPMRTYSWLKSGTISDFNFGDYYVGNLDVKRIKHLCQIAGSDYHRRYKDLLKGRYAISRDIKSIRTVNWYFFRDTIINRIALVRNVSSDFNALIENYYSCIHHSLFDKFFVEMLQEQHLLIAAGSGYLDETELQKIPNTERVVIFHIVDKNGGGGFVMPNSSLNSPLIMEVPGKDLNIPKTQDMLRTDFNFTGFTNNKFHQTIKSYSLFTSKARRHTWKRNIDEAFLNYIIGLDLVFGEAEKSTESVSKRVAVVTYRKLSMPFDKQVKKVRALYGARSKYVHEGKSPDEGSFEDLKSMCDEVLFCMLRLQNSREFPKALTIEAWLKNLDLIGASIEAGLDQSKEFYESNGIYHS